MKQKQRPTTQATNQVLWPFPIKGVVLYAPFASDGLTGHCWEVILLVWTCYGGCWHCGEVAVVKKNGSYWIIAAGAYHRFYSMKQLGVFLLPLDGMLVHGRSFPRNLLGFPNNSTVLIYTPGWREALCESPRTQHSLTGQDSNLDRSLQGRAH